MATFSARKMRITPTGLYPAFTVGEKIAIATRPNNRPKIIYEGFNGLNGRFDFYAENNRF